MQLYTTKNVDRLRVIQAYLSGQYTRKMAAMNLGVTERQVTRIIQKYIQEGPESVIHGNIGKPAFNKYSDAFCQKIIELYKGKYGKNGVKLNFRHFKDKLEDEGISIAYSSMRRILLNNGIHPPEARATKHISPPRPRRIFAGELVQMDASIHPWLYKDFRSYALHGAIDDATDTITGLWLERSENIHGYQIVLFQTIKHYGIPKCFYTDNKNIFENPKRRVRNSRLKSPLFRSLLARLGIDLITTSNPRAKGRIERIWRTLQSRLLNELLLRRITTIEEANDFIEEYLPVLNKAFASNIEDSRNSFRLVPADYDYNQNLALIKEARVHGGCYLVISGHYYVITRQSTTDVGPIVLPDKVQLHKLLDNSYHVLCNGEWYDLEDMGPRSAHKELIGRERAGFARNNTNSPWRQFNPDFCSRARTKWDEENLRKDFHDCA